MVTIATADTKSGALDAVLVADTVIQVGGLAMLIAGAALRRDILVWQGDQARLFFTASIGTTGTGLRLGSRF